MTFWVVATVIFLGALAALIGFSVCLLLVLQSFMGRRECGDLYVPCREGVDPYLAFDANQIARTHRVGGQG